MIRCMQLRNGRRREPQFASQDAFTLIELMVVVLIIGILIAVALPTFLGVRTRAQDRAAQANLRTALAASLTFFAESGTFTGFDAGCTPVLNSCTQAEATDPSLNWRGAGVPSPGELSLQVASGGNLLIITKSMSDEFFCVAQIPLNPATERGHSGSFVALDEIGPPLECQGGW